MPHLSRRRLLLAVAVVLALLGVGLTVLGLRGHPGPPVAGADRPVAAASAPADDAPTERRPASTAPPVLLDIPVIGVHSVVNQVGLEPDGTLETPVPGPDYDEAAWYRGSPVPGRPGPSVIIGHVDSAAAGPSVFYDLGRLRPGDGIIVTAADSARREFVVDAVRTVPKNDFPQRQVYGATAHPELRLITCGGDFDPGVGHYEDNTIVFAHLRQP
ncbi:class F sortase [Actinomycetospora chlora]|uniref:Class F sortase n=1 Tax=Actinomycetospora chlora TaxID=663608 RepID=A0ABP9BM01_9PSEU